jgi:peptidyl-tRNA hydrolase
MGIGRPLYGDVSSWVLGNFTTEEMVILEKVFKLTGSALDALLVGEPLSKLQTKYNKKLI